METISFLCLFTFGIFGCYEPEQISPEREQLLEEYKEVDLKIMSYVGTLVAPTTPKKLRTQIICKDFPTTYEQEYKPLMIKLDDSESSYEILKTFDSYKTRYNIKC